MARSVRVGHGPGVDQPLAGVCGRGAWQARRGGGRRAAAVAGAAIAVLLPSLFYYGIGWIQFGYRYGLDAMPFLLLLALLGAGRLAVRPRVLLLLFACAFVVNAWGALWMMGLWGLPRADVG
ncbi:MAG: hypothetical protein ACR2MY_14160 [Candidatus Dormibacteria bacterium]